LSSLSREEAQELVERKEGRLCGRFWQRSDGTVMTKDCPVGIQAARRRLALVVCGVGGSFLMLVGWSMTLLGNPRGPDFSKRRLRDIEPFHTIIEWLDPSPPPVMVGMIGLCPPDSMQPNAEDAGELKPQQVVDAFLQELRTEQWEDAYQRTSIGFQDSMSQSDFNALIERNSGLVGWTRKLYKGAERPGGQMMEMKGHVSGGPNPGVDFTIEVSLQPQGWRITKFTLP
jgi:hypothetical protein